jgi:serine/threonine-protein kinase
MDTKVADPLRGALLAGRYRVMGRLASGSTATVYQARDERLDRSVAVKIVNPEYALDAEVADRLADEAQTVAHLPHPNIVAVYDQGTHEGAPFLVMEYVRGRTLRDVLAERGRLDPSESLAIVEQILAALAAAHRRGLVHRDIKPETVLIAPPPNGSGDLVDGVVKVADFTRARAADIGRSSARPLVNAPYVAPELITDGRADARADVYSAGIVLFEMLTGRVPFGDERSDGRSPKTGSEAWQHVDEEVPPPSQLVPDVPALLDAVVGRATRRDPAVRPRDAGAMLAEIQATREDVAALAGPTRAIAHPTMVVPLADQPDRPAWSRLPAQRAGRAGAPTMRVRGQDALGTHHQPRAGVPHSSAQRFGGWVQLSANRLRYTAKGRRQLTAAAIVLGLLLIGGGWWFGIGRYTEAPSFLQLTKENAIQEAQRQGFEITIGAGIYSEQVPMDTVIAQQPLPGGRVVRGGTITLNLSLGPERYAVPEIAGQAYEFAITQMPRHFIVEKADGYSDTLPVGYVVSTEPPAGTVLPPGSTVRVVVVTGPFPVHVPSVVGRLLTDAENQLRQSGFNDIDVLRAEGDEPRDTVLQQTPEGGTGLPAATGQKVTLIVSNGPALAMPNVTNPSLTCKEAQELLQGMGLQVEVEGNDVAKAVGYARQQEPAADTPLQPGQQVRIRCEWP